MAPTDGRTAAEQPAEASRATRQRELDRRQALVDLEQARFDRDQELLDREQQRVDAARRSTDRELRDCNQLHAHLFELELAAHHQAQENRDAEQGAHDYAQARLDRAQSALTEDQREIDDAGFLADLEAGGRRAAAQIHREAARTNRRDALAGRGEERSRRAADR